MHFLYARSRPNNGRKAQRRLLNLFLGLFIKTMSQLVGIVMFLKVLGPLALPIGTLVGMVQNLLSPFSSSFS